MSGFVFLKRHRMNLVDTWPTEAGASFVAKSLSEPFVKPLYISRQTPCRSDVSNQNEVMSANVRNVGIRLSDAEELANAITHGVACVGAALATLFVLASMTFSGDVSRVSFLVYGCSLVLVFVMSTLSHVVRDPQRLDRVRAWDQGAIYLLIAGTYTPGITAFAEGGMANGLLLFVWGVGAIGFYSKVFAGYRVNSITTVTYLLLGWVPAMFLLPIVPFEYFLWLLAGGVCYSAGVVFLLNDRRVRFFHAGWHLWVMLAAAIHFYAICSMAI